MRRFLNSNYVILREEKDRHERPRHRHVLVEQVGGGEVAKKNENEPIFPENQLPRIEATLCQVTCRILVDFQASQEKRVPHNPPTGSFYASHSLVVDNSSATFFLETRAILDHAIVLTTHINRLRPLAKAWVKSPSLGMSWCPGSRCRFAHTQSTIRTLRGDFHCYSSSNCIDYLMHVLNHVLMITVAVTTQLDPCPLFLGLRSVPIPIATSTQ